MLIPIEDLEDIEVNKDDELIHLSDTSEDDSDDFLEQTQELVYQSDDNETVD